MENIKKIAALLCLSIMNFYAIAQKKPIDFKAIDNWTTVSDKAKVSDNGKYMAYELEPQSGRESITILRSTDGKWEKRLGTVSLHISMFSKNKDLFLYQNRDILHLVRLGSNEVKQIKSVTWSKFTGALSEEYFIYQLRLENANLLMIQNLKTGKEYSLKNVNGLPETLSSKLLVVELANSKGYGVLDLRTGKIDLISADNHAENFVINKNGSQIAFIALDSLKTNKGINNHKICLYDIRTRKISILMDGNSEALPKDMYVAQISGFCGEDASLILEMQMYPNEPNTIQNPKAVDVMIWSYKDSNKQIFKELKKLPQTKIERKYKAQFILANRKFVLIENQNTRAELKSENIWLISTIGSNPEDEDWNEYVVKQRPIALIECKTGRRIDLKGMEQVSLDRFYISPSCKFIIYYDGKKAAYFSYQMQTGKHLNITENIDVDWTYGMDEPVKRARTLSAHGWVRGKDILVVNDRNDIWLLDATGAGLHRNITNGLGKRKNLHFSLIDEIRESGLDLRKTVNLLAFDRNDKSNSFYKISLTKGNYPELLSSWNAMFFSKGIDYVGRDNFIPLKAAGEVMYILRKSTATESGNFFATKDFKNLIQLSDVQPQKEYQWLTTELLNYQLVDGSKGQGVLYKPEDFDANKKYPVIIYYYERLTDEMHTFPKPAKISAAIDIPWFTSRGYLVLCVDVFYKEDGKGGQSAFNYVNSATDYISKLSYINSKKIGLFGHSWGGFETNYIITHSNRFAAALSGAGLSDMTAAWGSVWGNRSTRNNFVAYGQLRLGVNPWENSITYVENSPIYRADKVSTPVLFMHNINDPNVDFNQGLSMFLALRRCGKPSWLLQYDGQTHTIKGDQFMIDYTNRITDFFDYYLKDGKLPKWMNSGAPAELKRDLVGYEENLRP